MKLNIILLLVFGFFMMTTLSYGQSVSEIDPDEYFSELNLTAEQQSHFDAIQTEYYNDLNTVSLDGSKSAAYKSYKGFKKQRNSDMKEILSKDQFKLYTKKQKALEKQVRQEYTS
ncbi:MAG: hypothetical protein OCD76_11045 [Reichenbachiella sp.]